MGRRLIGMFSGDTPVEEIVAAIEAAIAESGLGPAPLRVEIPLASGAGEEERWEPQSRPTRDGPTTPRPASDSSGDGPSTSSTTG